MAEPFVLSAAEKINLRAEVPKVLELITNDTGARAGFFKEPFNFLGKNFTISILRYFSKSGALIESFDETIRSIFERFGRFVNKCAVCKLIALLLIYAILGHSAVGLLVLGTFEIIDMVISKVEEVLDKTGCRAEEIFNYLKGFAEQIKPKQLALKICTDLNQCNGDFNFGQPTLAPSGVLDGQSQRVRIR